MAIAKYADNQWHDVSNPPNYGNWILQSVSDNRYNYMGDSDVSKLPVNIPIGSTAITTASELYLFNGTEWKPTN